MKKFEILEEKIITGTKIYKWIVEANSEDEALNIIKEGEIDPVSFTDNTEDDTYDSIDIEIKEINQMWVGIIAYLP